MQESVLTMKNSASMDVSNLLELALQNLDYDRESVTHYTFLVENALIEWRENLPQDSELTFRRKDTPLDCVISLSLPGKKLNPLQVKEKAEHEDEDKINTMVDKLLSGVGSELGYRYRKSCNVLTLRLPKKNARETLFRRSLFVLFLPIFLQQFLELLAQNGNALMLGFLDADSMSAVSIVAKFIQIHTNIIFGIVSAVTVLLAQYHGIRDHKRSRQVSGIGLKLSLMISLVFALVSFLMPKTLLGLYTDIPELIVLGSRYLRLMSLFFLLYPVYAIGYCVLRTGGRIRESVLFTLIGCAVTLIANAVFIFGLKEKVDGIIGAALALIISALVQVLFVVVFMARHSAHRMELQGLLFKNPLSKNFFSTVLPLVAQSMVWIVGINIVTSAFGHMEKAMLEANSALNIVFSIVVDSSRLAFGSAGALLIGNLLGKGKLDTAKERSSLLMKMSFLFGLLAAAIFALVSYLMRFLPMNLSAEAVQWMTRVLLIYSVASLCAFMNNVINVGMLVSGGDTTAILIIDAIVVWGILVPVSLLSLTVRIPTLLLVALLKSDELISLPIKIARARTYKWLKKLT